MEIVHQKADGKWYYNFGTGDVGPYESWDVANATCQAAMHEWLRAGNRNCVSCDEE